ncbi:MAG: 4Fe-4S dicluster domain-containing protein [Candidatus Manganitrophaceae bacterium]
MDRLDTEPPRHGIVQREALQRLFDVLKDKGYSLAGPTIRDNAGEKAIVYDELHSVSDLPIGWTDEQNGGSYRLKQREDAACFGYAAGPHSWKKYLLSPEQRLWRAEREGKGFRMIDEKEVPPKLAFIGVRSCELHAIAIQDRVLLEGDHIDLFYQGRRENIFVVAVQCAVAGATCFCASMKTGPKATFGFDLALTEIIEENRHYFVVETGTDRGAALLQEVPHTFATEADQTAAERVIARTAERMGRTMETDGLKELLYQNLEHPRWEEVAARCLSCGNCTLVCPTCFCTTIEDVTDLTGNQTERWQKWDSCFTLDFSYVHGGSIRSSAKARYRQWMTHKLATWHDQFGTSGCVGCGRCITWCPVGIDLTEEARAIRRTIPENRP